MDLQHIRSFVAVAREGNLTRAAEALFLTQPAVSIQLKNFQQELDLTLLVRTSKGLSLTADGQEILPLAERVLAAVRHLQERAAHMQTSMSGELSIGTTMNPEITRLGTFLSNLVTAYPRLQTKLHHGMTGLVKSDILKGVLDAGYYVAGPEETIPPELHALHLTVFTHFVIAPQGWRSRLEGKSWKELAQMPWIWPYPNSVYNRLLTAKFQRHGLIPNVVAEADVEASMLDMVRCGMGLALARQPVAIREAEAHGLVMLEDLPLPSNLYFIAAAQRKDEPLIMAAFDAVQSAFQA
ncbi:LysR family transcriptional regulator [Alcaligenaceae bacterium]|nr:LysR family transcriptional regulator [Alcaligenaceae bacterium]